MSRAVLPFVASVFSALGGGLGGLPRRKRAPAPKAKDKRYRKETERERRARQAGKAEGT